MYMRSTRPSPPIFIHKEKAWWGEGGRSWSCTHGCCSESTPRVRESHLSVRKCTYGPLTSKIIVIYIKTSHRRAYYRKVFRNFAPRRFDFTVWFVCVANEAELWRGGGGSFTFRFSFFLLLLLLKVRTQRPLSSGQPTLQMAGGSEAVSTLKRAKSRGFSPAGEDRAWMGYFHQPL